MREEYLWILVILALAVLIPVLGHVLRERSFRAQVSGKKPEEKLPEGAKLSYEKHPAANAAAEAEKTAAWMKSKQNMLGPK